MKRFGMLLVLVAAALALAAAGLADPGDKGKGKKHTKFTATVTVRDKGTFVTLAAPSPGACDTTGKHGHLVIAGVQGKFRGYLTGTVTGGTFTPNATCNAACMGNTAAFIAAFFPGGTFTCSQGFAGCKFNFEYSSPDKRLIFHHWQDKGTNGVTEQFTGDIATS